MKSTCGFDGGRSERDASEDAARARLFDQLVDELADAVATRVLAEMERTTTASPGFRLLNVDDVAVALGRSSRWVRERVKRGELPYVRLDGGALAFEEDEVRAFAEARRVGSPLAGRLRVAAAPSVLRGQSVGDPVGNRKVDR